MTLSELEQTIVSSRGDARRGGGAALSTPLGCARRSATCGASSAWRRPTRRPPLGCSALQPATGIVAEPIGRRAPFAPAPCRPTTSGRPRQARPRRRGLPTGGPASARRRLRTTTTCYYFFIGTSERDRSSEEVIDEVRRKIESAMPRLRVEFVQILSDVIDDLAGAARPVEIKLYGADLDALETYAKSSSRSISKLEGSRISTTVWASRARADDAHQQCGGESGGLDAGSGCRRR